MLKRELTRLVREEDAATAVEYAVIAALVGVLVTRSSEELGERQRASLSLSTDTLLSCCGRTC